MKIVVPVPTINANDDSVVVVRWHVADGSTIEAGAPLVDVETTKAVSTVQAEVSGWVRHRCREGDEIAVGGELAWVFSAKEELTAAIEATAPALTEALAASAPSVKAADAAKAFTAATLPAAIIAEPTAFSTTRLSQAAQKLAAEIGCDPRTLAEQNLGLVTQAKLRLLTGGKRATSKPPAAITDDGRRRERLPAAKKAEIEALRLGAGENLVSSLRVQFNSREVRAAVEKLGQGLLPLVLAELAQILAGKPKFTAFFDGEAIGFHDAVNLGVAIDFGEGLTVVVIQGADRLDATAIGDRLAELTLDYMERKLAVSAVQGATFTVTDLSALDVISFEPLINGRQAAILAIGADSTQPGFPMTLTMAFDHRVLTGREVGEVLASLRSRILSYAAASPAEAEGLPLEPEAPCCDMCMIDLESYYREFGAQRYAVMTQYLRPDGSSGLICHRCQSGHT